MVFMIIILCLHLDHNKGEDPPTHPPTHPSTHPPIHPSTHPPTHPSTHPPIHPTPSITHPPYGFAAETSPPQKRAVIRGGAGRAPAAGRLETLRRGALRGSLLPGLEASRALRSRRGRRPPFKPRRSSSQRTPSCCFFFLRRGGKEADNHA